MRGGYVTAYEQKADRSVREFIKLSAEGSHRTMVDALKDSAVAKIQPEGNDYTMINFDAALAGESTSSPWSRRCPVSPPAVKKIMAAILEARCVDGELAASDLFVFQDAGKHGSEAALLGSLVDPMTGKALPKQKRTLYVTYNEEAIADVFARFFLLSNACLDLL